MFLVMMAGLFFIFYTHLAHWEAEWEKMRICDTLKTWLMSAIPPDSYIIDLFRNLAKNVKISQGDKKWRLKQ